MLKSIRTGKAFTLAEVLITLGIIGVVAAMTMPTLMNSTNGAQYKTAYKKALSVLSQAIVMNVALDDFDLSQTDDTGTGTDSQSIYTMLKNRMNVIKTGTSSEYKLVSTVAHNGGSTGANEYFGGSASGANYTLYFNDGIAFSFPKTAHNCTEGSLSTSGTAGIHDNSGKPVMTNGCVGIIDVNGAKSPNKVVVCDTGTDGDKCVVSNPSDIYPVMFYDQTILPSTDAGRAVLYGK